MLTRIICLAVTVLAVSAQEYHHGQVARRVGYNAPSPTRYVTRGYAPTPRKSYRSEYRPTTYAHDRRQYDAEPVRQVYRSSSSYAPRRTAYRPAPQRTYSGTRSIYSAPRQSYSAPRQSYASTPRQAYSAPRQSYSAPWQSYSAPRQAYSAPRQTYSAAPNYEENYDRDAQYEFGYQTKAYGGGYGGDGYGNGGQDSAEFGHTETRNGDQTNGKYWVELPDGRLQTVEYAVDGYSGYLAKVSYTGGDGYRSAGSDYQ